MLLRASLKAQREILGREHPDVTVTLANLATALFHQQRWAESEAVNREALAIVRAQFGPSHWLVDSIQANLANSIDAQGRSAEAIPYLRQTLELRRRNFGPEHPMVAQVFLLLAGAHRKLKEYPQAIRSAQEGLHILEKANDPHVDSALRELGRDYLEQGRPAKAEPYLRRSFEIRREQLPPTHLDLAKIELTLARCLSELGRVEEAESLLRKAEPIVRRQAAAAVDQVQEIQALKAKLQSRR